MIVTNVEGLRDPFILVEDGACYMYGTQTDDTGTPIRSGAAV